MNSREVCGHKIAYEFQALFRAAFAQRSRIEKEVFKIGGGMTNSLSLLELFALLGNKLGFAQELVYTPTPRRQSDQDFFVADIRKAQTRLHWTPQVNAEAGIQHMLAWLEN